MKKNKVAIITGASRGIGKAIALKLQKNGLTVVLVSKNPNNLKIALEDFNKKTIAISADVSKEKNVVTMVAKIIRKFGRIDILVNNAGSSAFKKIEETTRKDFNETIGTNLGGVFYCMRECIKQMKKQAGGGQIINISSTAAKTPLLFPGRSLHSATKAAISALAAGIQAEMIRDKKNIKIATIYPGIVFTESMARRGTRDPEELRRNALKPEDIAHIVWMIVRQGKNSNITEVIIQPLFTPSVINK